MFSNRQSIWKRIQELAVVLMLVGAFAPVPDSLGAGLSVLGAVLLLAHFRVTSREERRARETNQSSSAAISSSDKV
ncbi:MAG TPA: hypothetical protein VIT89_11920 [Solirubrobacterales bacterium]